MFQKIKQFARGLIDAIFPRHCLSCEKDLSFEASAKKDGVVLCPACRSTWSPPCPAVEPGRIASFFYADPIVRRLICDWKYSFDDACREELLRHLKTRLGSVKQLVRNERIEAVCYVPLHAVKKRVRGFDQAEIIGRFVARKTQRTFLPLLIRTKTTTSQADKKEAERRLIVANNPFVINPAFLVPKRVLLVDDVWTTGSTVAAATEVLMRAGVEKVIVYTVAQG